MTGGQIFLSYSRADSDFALRLGSDLRKSGIDIWIDQHDIPPAVPWDEEIQKGLDESTGLLVVLSATSVDSDNVLNEINYALETGKQVWPILIQTGIKKPFNINRLQHIDFTTSYEGGLQLLLNALRTGRKASPPVRSRSLRRTAGFVVAAAILVAAIIGFLVYRQSNFTGRDQVLVNAKPPVNYKLIDGNWRSGVITNPFDPNDHYTIAFNLTSHDSLVAGDLELKATADGKGYQVKRPFRDGKFDGQQISFYTSEESFKGGETVRFKNFYHGILNADSISFVLTSDRPWDFPEQKFSARK